MLHLARTVDNAVGLGGFERRLVTTLSWPLLVRYGYSLGRSRPSPPVPR